MTFSCRIFQCNIYVSVCACVCVSERFIPRHFHSPPLVFNLMWISRCLFSRQAFLPGSQDTLLWNDTPRCFCSFHLAWIITGQLSRFQKNACTWSQLCANCSLMPLNDWDLPRLNMRWTSEIEQLSPASAEISVGGFEGSASTAPYKVETMTVREQFLR